MKPGNQTSRFEHVHVDIVGSLPVSHGCRYRLTCIYRFTRWTEAVPTTNIEISTATTAFIEGWIARFGIPKKITVYQGK